MGNVPHGTVSGYNYHRCRCDECRAAKAAVKRRYAAQRRRAGVICSVDGCTKVVAGADPYCSAHRARVTKNGGVGSAHTRTNDGVARHYQTAHNRLRMARGSASEYGCVECGGSAEDWSLKQEAQFRTVGASGPRVGLAFSPDPYDYEPRCRKCHAVYDGYGGRRGRTDDSPADVPAPVRDEEES